MEAITVLQNVTRNTLCPIMTVGKRFEGKIGSWPHETGAFFFFFVRQSVCVWLSYSHHINIPSIFLLRTRSGAAARYFKSFSFCTSRSFVPLPSDSGQGMTGPGITATPSSPVSSPVLHLKLQTLGGAGYLLVACGCTVNSVFTGNSTRLARGRAHFPTATIGFPALCIKD